MIMIHVYFCVIVKCSMIFTPEPLSNSQETQSLGKPILFSYTSNELNYEKLTNEIFTKFDNLNIKEKLPKSWVVLRVAIKYPTGYKNIKTLDREYFISNVLSFNQFIPYSFGTENTNQKDTARKENLICNFYRVLNIEKNINYCLKKCFKPVNTEFGMKNIENHCLNLLSEECHIKKLDEQAYNSLLIFIDPSLSESELGILFNYALILKKFTNFNQTNFSKNILFMTKSEIINGFFKGIYDKRDCNYELATLGLRELNFNIIVITDEYIYNHLRTKPKQDEESFILINNDEEEIQKLKKNL